MADSEGYIPVYLPDRTVVGKGKVDGQHITIKLKEGDLIQTLFKDNLLGMSFVYMGEGQSSSQESSDCDEVTCLYSMPHNHGGACFAGCVICD